MESECYKGFAKKNGAYGCCKVGYPKSFLYVDSGDSWMYPYQRTPMGNPYISPIYPYIVGVYGLLSPRIPIFSPYKYHGYTYVRGTPVLVP